MNDLLIFNHIEMILAGTTAGLFVIQLLYYLVTYARPLRQAKKKTNATGTGKACRFRDCLMPRTNRRTLKKHLPALLNHDYPEYEIVVVNDGSTDESDEVLKTFKNEYDHLYHTYIPEDVKYLSRKKLALTVGIKAAKHDILLFYGSQLRTYG